VARRWAHWLGRNLARLHYARHVEPTWLEVNNHCIPIRDLPAAFQGFRIVQISDMHVGPKLTARYLDEIVDSALAEQPDLIALTGDFIHKGFRHVSRAARSISRLRAPHGVFAVLGNHDFSVRNALGLRRHRHLHRAVATALSDVGARVLRNETTVLRLGDAAVDLVGVDDLWSGECDLAAAYGDHDPRRPRLVLAHNPRTIEGLDGRRCDLMLSGHTHGGQVNLPKLGRVTLSKKTRRFAAGLYTVDSTVLYVNKGVGFGWRFRYGVRPEIAVLMLDRV
jgi:hypothetical protein